MAGCGRWVLLVVSLAAGLHRPALAEKRYQYGGVDKTGEHLGVMPKETGVDFSGPNQGFCDGCLSTVETFHLQWLKYVTKESAEGDEVDQKSGGSAPPAITYNDEVEDMVNDMCKSKGFRAEGLSDQMTEVCQSMIGTEEVKRKIVAQFLAKDLAAKLLVGRKREACEVGGLVNACAVDETSNYAFDIGDTSDCDLCNAVVDDALYEVRRKKHTKGAWTERSLNIIMDTLCTFGVMRHGDERADPVFEKCDAMLDEDSNGIVRAIIKHMGEPELVKKEVCGELIPSCGAEGGGGGGGGKKGKGGKKKKKKSKKKKADL